MKQLTWYVDIHYTNGYAPAVMRTATVPAPIADAVVAQMESCAPCFNVLSQMEWFEYTDQAAPDVTADEVVDGLLQLGVEELLDQLAHFEAAQER